MDGRRVPPSSNTNLVDADVIPQLLIQRVDVVTGGVSAVYGSDAVSGVVNFITDTKFTGFKAQAQAGISQYGDDAQQEIGAAWGTRFADDRGHFEVSYEYRNSDGVLHRSDRSWYNRPVVIGNGTTVPYQLVTNATLPGSPFGGRITCGTGNAGCPSIGGYYFANDGVLSPFANGTTYTGVTNAQSGGAGGYYDNSLKASQRSHQAYARVDYDLTDNIKAFASLSGNFKKNVFYGNDLTLSAITINKNNYFFSQIPGATAAITAANGNFTFNQIVNRDLRLKATPETTQINALAGIEGKVGAWNWDVAYSHGYSRLKTVLNNNLNQQKLSAALDSVAGVGGATCYAATQAATSAAYAGCVALNPFGPTAASAAALDYVLDDSTYIARTTQDDVTASISGSPFAIWAGDVNVALSGEWRKQSFSSSSDAQPTMFADCTNLRYNCVSTAPSQTFVFQNTFAASPLVKQSVKEVALEASVPLLKDVPFFQRLDVNGAVRYTKYDTVGSYWTWKAGLDWAVNDSIRFRGTISRDIRAPTLNDLYAPTSVVAVNNADNKYPADAVATKPSVNVSNSSLTAEIGNTKTFGVVFKPSFVPGFSLAVDYYDIKISNAITTLQGFSDAVQSGCAGGNALYCSLIVRDATTDRVTQWLVKPYNLAKVTTYGVDVEANYVSHAFGRPLALRGLAAYQPHIRYIQPGVATVDQGGVAFGAGGLTSSPSVRLTGTVSVSPFENFRVDALYRWRNRMKLTGVPGVTWTGDDSVRPYGQASLNLAWAPEVVGSAKSEFFINIQNLFNVTPPYTNATGTQTGAGTFGGFAITDDPIGRTFTAGFRVKF